MSKKALYDAEQFALSYGLDERDSRRLRLVTEEINEMVKDLDPAIKGEFEISGDENSVILRMIFYPGRNKKHAVEDISKISGITAKLRYFINCSYQNIPKIRAERIGMLEADQETLREMGVEGSKKAYVWTIESYYMASLDLLEEGNSIDWTKISCSIIASIADDIRLFVFRDRTELTVHMKFRWRGVNIREKYGINSEFDDLAKVPVPKTKFQIKLIQLAYRNLSKKQTSTDSIKIRSIEVPTRSSPHNAVTVLEYSDSGIDDDKETPCILFLHGGAFMFPAKPYHYSLAEKIVKRIPCRLFFVLHDLAPKYNPPVQNKEAFDVYHYLLDNYEELHIDEKRIVVMGDCSGGTMAAATALLARDHGIIPPAGLLLLYPSLDSNGNSASRASFTDVPIINGEAITAYKKLIHPDEEEGNRYYIFPAEAESLSGLCDTYIETAEFDALHDEGVAFAKRMEEEGGRVILNETKGTVHAFDMAKDSSILEEAVRRRVDFLETVMFDKSPAI